MPDQSVDCAKANAPNWHKQLKPEEKQRLEVIEERISRKETSISELVAERKAMMRRAIMRGRRQRSKEIKP